MIGAVIIALFGLVTAVMCGMAAYKHSSTWLAPFLAAMSGGGLMISMFGLGLAEAYYAKHSVLIFVPFAGFLFFVILLVTTGFGYSAWRKKANGNGR